MIKWLTITSLFLFVSNSVLSQKNKELILTTKLPEYLYHSIEGFGYGTCGNDKVGIVVKQKKKSITLYDHENKRVTLLRNFYKYDSLTTIKLSKTQKDITINLSNDSVFVLRDEFKNVDYNFSYIVDKCNPHDWDGEDSGLMNVLTNVIVSNTGIDNSNKLPTTSKSVSKDSIKSKMIRDFFPIPFIDIDTLSNISIDSVIKHIMNTTEINDMSSIYERHTVKVSGKGSLIKDIPDYIYHNFLGMQSFYKDDIITYYINPTNNKLNYPLDNDYVMSSDGTVDMVRTFPPKRQLYIVHNDGMYEYISRFVGYVTSTNVIGDTSYFPLNNRTKKQEGRIKYLFLGNKLSSLTFSLNKYGNPEDGSVSNPLAQSSNKQLISKFFSQLDRLFGKSKLLRGIISQNIERRVWKKGNMILSVGIHTGGVDNIELCDDHYTRQYYDSICSQFKSSNNNIPPIDYFYGDVYQYVIKGYCK